MNETLLRKISIQTDNRVTAIAFHPHAQSVLAGTKSGNVEIYDLINGKRIHTLSKYKAPILAIGFNEDTIYTFDEELEVFCWDLNSLAFKSSHYIGDLWGGFSEITNHAVALEKRLESRIISAQFDPRGRYLICHEEREGFCGSYSRLAKIDLQKYCVEGCYKSEHRDGENLDKIAISRDGVNICASGLDIYVMTDGDYNLKGDFIDQWNLEDRSLTCSYECNDIGLSLYDRSFVQTFSPDSKQILVSLNNDLTLWNVGEGRIENGEEEHLGFFGMTEVEWSPVSDLVAFAKGCGTIGFYDMRLRKIVFEEKLFTTSVSCIQFSSDGCFVGAFSDNPMVEIIQVLPSKLPRLSPIESISSNVKKSYRELQDINEIILSLKERFPDAHFRPIGIGMIEINRFLCLPTGFIDHLDKQPHDQTDLERLVCATQDVNGGENQITLKLLKETYRSLQFYQAPYSWLI